MDGAPVIIGLLGGIASGKSMVAGILGRLGAIVIDADRIAHSVLESSETGERLAGIFGKDILDSRGRPDRGKIAERAFADLKMLRQLEELIHPRVRKRIRKQVERANDADAIVIDAPLLLEGGLEPLTDVLVFVRTSTALREERAHGRGWDDDEIREREARQAPLAEKRDRATYVIENEGTLEELERRVRRFYQEIRKGVEGSVPGDS